MGCHNVRSVVQPFSPNQANVQSSTSPGSWGIASQSPAQKLPSSTRHIRVGRNLLGHAISQREITPRAFLALEHSPAPGDDSILDLRKQTSKAHLGPSHDCVKLQPLKPISNKKGRLNLPVNAQEKHPPLESPEESKPCRRVEKSVPNLANLSLPFDNNEGKQNQLSSKRLCNLRADFGKLFPSIPIYWEQCDKHRPKPTTEAHISDNTKKLRRKRKSQSPDPNTNSQTNLSKGRSRNGSPKRDITFKISNKVRGQSHRKMEMLQQEKADTHRHLLMTTSESVIVKNGVKPPLPLKSGEILDVSVCLQNNLPKVIDNPETSILLKSVRSKSNCGSDQDCPVHPTRAECIHKARLETSKSEGSVILELGDEMTDSLNKHTQFCDGSQGNNGTRAVPNSLNQSMCLAEENTPDTEAVGRHVSPHTPVECVQGDGLVGLKKKFAGKIIKFNSTKSVFPENPLLRQTESSKHIRVVSGLKSTNQKIQYPASYRQLPVLENRGSITGTEVRLGNRFGHFPSRQTRSSGLEHKQQLPGSEM